MLHYVLSALAGLAGIVALLGYFKYPWLVLDIQEIVSTRKLRKVVAKLLTSKTYIVDIFEEWVKRQPNKIFLAFGDQEFSYEDAHKEMNRVANFVRDVIGLKPNDIVSILFLNEPRAIWNMYGLTLTGLTPACINFNLRGDSLLHCIQTSGSKQLIVGDSPELLNAVGNIKPQLDDQHISVYVQGREAPDGYKLFNVSESSSASIDRDVRPFIPPMDTACLIYTSGTTGLPKAAVVTHRKTVLAAGVFAMAGLKQEDRLYVCLPLYHTSGLLVGIGGAILTGSTVILSPKFSASHFWEDCRRCNVTVVLYIGELMRYLVNTPVVDDEHKHKVRMALGNGLRSETWTAFQKRFKVSRIIEFYGATEANTSTFNFHNRVGACGRLSPLRQLLVPLCLVKYDMERDEVIRDTRGRCIKAVGEPGLLIANIRRDMPYSGYHGNQALSDKKVLCDVFEEGDRYYNSGDVMTLDRDYFLYFTDRVGDTFRWKGENVSTTEVTKVMSRLDWIKDVNVFGVKIPGAEGRAGMACIQTDTQLSEDQLKELYVHLEITLPLYARPLFLRAVSEIELTGTFKQIKHKVLREGFNIHEISDPMYFQDRQERSYVPIEVELYTKMMEGKIRF